MLIIPLSSGIILNKGFLSSYYSLFLLLNPLYIHFSLFTSLYLQDSCNLSFQSDSIFNDHKFCQMVVMNFFGFSWYEDQSYGLFLLFLWIIFINCLTILGLYIRTITKGITHKRGIRNFTEIVNHHREVVILEEKGQKKEIEMKSKYHQQLSSPQKIEQSKNNTNKNNYYGYNHNQKQQQQQQVEDGMDSSISSINSNEVREIRTPQQKHIVI